MNKGTIALTGLGVGAGVMYFADPQEGGRRRARLRDSLVHTGHVLEVATGRTSRDIENRVAGLAARAAASVVPQSPPIDDVLVARVRTRIGRLVSHPGAIEVKAASDRITLSGPVFEAEVEQLLAGVRAVRGVAHVNNQLEPHAHAGDISALQGPGPLKLHRAPSRWIRWTPTTRVMVGATGLALIAWAARHRTIRGTAVGLTGFELLEQAVRGARAGVQARATS
jgi:hypothetical protein